MKAEMNLPAGITVRPFRLEDAEETIALLNRVSQALVQVDLDDLTDGMAFWTSSEFVIGEDALVAVSPEGRIVAYAEIPSNIPPFARMYTFARVDPAWCGRGIGRYLLRWTEKRAREVLKRAEPDIQVAAVPYVLQNDQAANELLISEGYLYQRTSWLMEINLEGEIPAAPLPAGVTIRGIEPREDEYRRLFRTAQNAFRDHYGFVDRPFEQYYEMQMHYVKNEEHHPELFLVAEKDGEVIGCSLCTPKSSISETMGWINTLGVLREQRGAGIGSALLKESFRALKRFGKTRAGLGVDSSNLTGAVRIYQRAGMKVMTAFNMYEKVLRPGRDIVTRALESN